MGKRLQGVDTNLIAWDQQSNGHKSLGLHRDTRPLKARYEAIMKLYLPMLLVAIFVMAALIHWQFSDVYMIFSLLCIGYWKKRFRKIMDKSKTISDRPKYIDYTPEASDIDFQPKAMDDTVKDLLKKQNRISSPGKAVYFIGHELFTSQEIHFDDDKMRTHVIIFGTTGSGKTEMILSICVNFLVQASGFILVDGKGDSLLFSKVFSLTQAFCRTDDLYLLNFMDPGERAGKTVQKISNTFNFLVETTASECNEIMGGLLPGDENGMWEGRATAGISALNDAVYYLFDNGFIELDPEVYQTYFDLQEFARLAQDTNIPKNHRKGLRTILTSINYTLPTNEVPNPQQGTATTEQWQYIVMQYTSTFQMLSNDYHHISVAQYPDISIVDIVLRRRILLVLLPSLSKSVNNVRNLGRIVISLTRNVSSKAIGAKVEGTYAEVIDSKPTSAINSYALIFDEYGVYATAGAEQLPAQVRSLNFVCLFAGQDYQAFKKGDENSAASIFANCTVKCCMKLEDPDETFDRFVKSAGERYVMKADSYEMRDSIFGRKYVAQESATVEKAPVLDVADLKSQNNGMGTWIYGSSVFRAQGFYADPIPVQKLRINHFIQVRAPKTPRVVQTQTSLDALFKKMHDHFKPNWSESKSRDAKITKFFLHNFAEILDTVSKINETIKKNPPKKMPTETEIILFSLCLHFKKIGLVDAQITRAVSESLGQPSDGDYDDDKYLLRDSSDSDDGNIETQVIPDLVRQSLVPNTVIIEKEEKNPSRQAVSPANTVSTSEKAIEGKIKAPMDSAALHKLFEKMNNEVLRKRKLLGEHREPAYDPFKTMKLDAFAVEEGIQRIEELILIQQGLSSQDAKTGSQLTAKALVADIAIKTDISIVSESKRKQTSPSSSSRKTRDMISDVLSRVR